MKTKKLTKIKTSLLLKLFLISFFLVTLPLISATLQPYINDYRIVSQTGEEEDYKVTFTPTEITYDEKSSIWEWLLDLLGLSEIKSYTIPATQICIEAEYEDETYPETLPFYKTEELVAQDSLEIDEVEIEDDKYKIKFCYVANPLEDFYLKFGDNSIVIIEITSAEHLNSSRDFVQDIFEYVNASDNITYTIPDGEYARVVFEDNLTNEHRIDIITNDSIGSLVYIYEEDGSEIIGAGNITQDGWTYINLNHTGNQTTFDLLSIGNVTYDLMIDPPAPPVWVGSLGDSPDPVTIGNNITYTGTGNDPDDEQYALYVCSSSSITDAPSVPTCDATEFCHSGLVNDETQASCQFNTTGQSAGDLNAWGFLCDSTNRCSSSSQATTTLQAPVGDTEFPIFSNYWDDNASLVDSGVGEFNVTLLSTNGTVLLEINGNNVTAKNYSSAPSVYNATYTFVSSGVYSYKWYAWGNGTSHNFNVSNIRSYTVNATPDTTNPNVTINSPLNTTYTTTTILFNVTTLDGGGISACLYSLNNGVTNYSMANLSTSVNDWTATNTSMSEGGHSVIYYCNDSSNNLNNTESVDFFIDSINPDISITAPSNNTNTTNPNLDVNYTASDTNLASCWYSNDTMTTNTTLASCITNITDVVWSEGTHHVLVWVNDSLGNTNRSSINFRIDTTPPYFTTFADQSIQENEGLSYDIDASDGGVGVESYVINWTTNFTIDIATGLLKNSSVLDVREYYINVSINDTLNNLNSSVILINVTGVDTPPTVSIIFPTNTTYTTSVTELNFTAYEGVGLSTCWYSTNGGTTNTTVTCGENVTGLTASDGSNTWSVWVNDTIGQEVIDNVSFEYDQSSDIISKLTSIETKIDAVIYYLENNISAEVDVNLIAGSVWNFTPDRNLTYYEAGEFTGDVNVNSTEIAEQVWNYTGTINDNILSQFASSIWSYTDAIAAELTSAFETSIWNYTNRYTHGEII